MVKVEFSKGHGRVIRQDDLKDIAIPSWVKAKEALQAGRIKEAIALLDYMPVEGKRINDLMCDVFWGALTFIADTYGEAELEKAFRRIGEPNYKGLAKLTPEQFMQLRVESMRVHRIGSEEMGVDRVVEEKDRYVLIMDPCGSGGRMRRIGRTGPPFNYGVTKKAYPWSFGKKGVPYYCCHCAMWSEIQPIEWFGYPARITDFNDDPKAPCIWYVYKSPELIPEEYFKRVGKTRDVTKFKKP